MNSTQRERIMHLLSATVRGRPVRWLDERTSRGDFDGRERTVEVFDVAAAEQRDFLHGLATVRARLDLIAGGRVTILLHTPEETSRLYPWVRER